MSRRSLLGCLVLCALLCDLTACDGGTGGGANSNTNWLLACEAPEDCGGPWDCLCGVCTSSCEDGCEGDGSVCAGEGSLAHGLTCEEDALALCLLGCTADDACQADEVCVNGACSPRPAADDCSAHDAALFCSGFEASELSAASLIDGGELAQSTTGALSGEGALAAKVEGDAQRSRARYDFTARTAGMLHLRAWMYLDVPDTAGAHVHTITIGSVDTATHGTDVHVLDGKLGLTFPSAGDITGTARVPARTWFCVRLEIALGAVDGTARIWLNGELSAEIDGADTLPPDGAHNLSIGIDGTDQPDMRVLFDDVLLSTDPVSCDQRP